MNDKEFQRYVNAPPPLVLKTGTTTKVLALIGVIFPILFCEFIIFLGQMKGHDLRKPMWCCMVVATLIIVLRSRWDFSYTLTLDRDHFTVKSSREGTCKYLWKESSGFEFTFLQNVLGTNSIGPDFVYFDNQSKGRCRLQNPDGAVWNENDLAKLMNLWRERAITAKSN